VGGLDTFVDVCIFHIKIILDMFGNLLGNMEEKKAAMQAELESKIITAESGSGLVKVEINGARKVLNIKIDPSLMTEGDAEAIEDLTMEAMNRVLEELANLEAEMASKMLRDMLPPGMEGFLPKD